jgi:hypothetical protein
VDLDRSCDNFARRQGCLEMWTLGGRFDAIIAGRLSQRNSNDEPEIRKIDQKELNTHKGLNRALLYRRPQRRYRVDALLAGCHW